MTWLKTATIQQLGPTKSQLPYTNNLMAGCFTCLQNPTRAVPPTAIGTTILFLSLSLSPTAAAASYITLHTSLSSLSLSKPKGLSQEVGLAPFL